jgi:hypothetical protein
LLLQRYVAPNLVMLITIWLNLDGYVLCIHITCFGTFVNYMHWTTTSEVYKPSASTLNISYITFVPAESRFASCYNPTMRTGIVQFELNNLKWHLTAINHNLKWDKLILIKSKDWIYLIQSKDWIDILHQVSSIIMWAK